MNFKARTNEFYGKPRFPVGRFVVYRCEFGEGEPEHVRVIDNTGDKNGEIVYDLSNGDWCYGSQIEHAAIEQFEGGRK